MSWIEAILIAVSLCADCFACTLCSGVTLRKAGFKTVTLIALAFAVIQAGLLWVGWEFGKHPRLISFRMDWLDLLAVQGILKSLLQYHSSKASILQHSAFFMVQLSQPYMTT